MSNTDMSEFDELLTVAKTKTEAIAESTTLNEMEQVQQQMEDAQNLKNKKERNRRMEVLETTMKGLRAQANQEEQDLAESVLGLNVFIEHLGGDYDSLTALNPDEQIIVDRAQSSLDSANAALKKVETAWFFRKSRTEKAETALSQAESKLTTAQTEAKKRQRQRLLSASMEDSLQEFQLRVEKTVSIMKDRLSEIQSQVQAVAARKTAAFAEKEKQAGLLKKAKDAVADLETALYDAERVLEGHPNGSAEYTQQERAISELKSKLEDAKGAREVALGVFQSKEKFAKELEVHEAAQKKLRNNQLVWIKTLTSDTEERMITFASRLEAMKAGADQEVAKELDDLGAAVDDSNAKYMAQSAVASDKIMEDKLAAHPERLAKMQETQNALTEHIQNADQNIKDVIERLSNRYGIDPTRSQFSKGDA